MFTGIIDHCGIIARLEKKQHSTHIWIQSNFSELIPGESIAVDGICLTVKEIQNNHFSCEISPESLAVTTAKYFNLSQKVNLERALLLSSRLGGHMVSGHIDQICQLKSISKSDQFVEMTFTNVQESNMNLLIKKGSIAVNGVSLTINNISENQFSIMLIPHTLQCTNLSGLSMGDNANIEFDMIAKLIAAQCKHYFTA